MRIALIGNPNCGKSTLFNEITGANQHIGNWPGVTVEKKEGKAKGYKNIDIIDLPGIYSLSPYTSEEVVSREFLLNGEVDVIINIVDSSNIGRNLYLTSQLMELDIPMIIALNKVDIIKNNIDFETDNISTNFTNVVKVSARDRIGIEELMKEAIQAASVPPLKRQLRFSIDIEKAINTAESYLDGYKNKRWYAIKALEGDEKTFNEKGIPEKIKKLSKELSDKYADDFSTVISNQRYQKINHIVSHDEVDLKKREESTDKLDSILTNKWLALPIFVLVISFIYYIAVVSVGTIVTDFTNDVIVGEWLQGGARNLLEGFGVAEILISLIVDGVIAGVGAVLGFLPQLVVLFFFLALLEQSGYISRVAFILDRILRKLGLSGKSFISMLIGTGCSIPGIMSARTIENQANKNMTVITTSFMPCGAKLPIIALITGTLFKDTWWVAPFTYFLGMAAVVVSGLILKKTKRFAGDTAPFVMELPDYQVPSAREVLRNVWDNVKSFVIKAATIITLSVILIWFLSNFTITSDGIAFGGDIQNSLLAKIGKFIANIFAPLGFGTWEMSVATIMGLIAKENVVTTFGVLFGVTGDALELLESGDIAALSPITTHFTQLSGISFLLFNLLCAPCFAAVGAMKRELGNANWTLFAVGYQTIFAYAISFIVFQFGTYFATGAFTLMTGLAIVVLGIFLYFMFRPAPKKDLMKK